MTTAKNGKRSVVLFLCHLINAQVIKQYRKLCRDIGKEYDIYWVFQTDNGISEKGLLTKGTKVFMFSMNDLNTLGYSYLEKLYGSEHYIMEFFARRFPKYDYYWVIEYDVIFTGKWNHFFDYFKNDKADFLSSHIERKNASNANWHWWNHMTFGESCMIPEDKYVKSFNPIYRISRRAVSFLDSYLKETGNKGFYEVVMATALYNNGFLLEDFGGTGDFVKRKNLHRFYVQDAGTNNGTMRGRPLFGMREGAAFGTKDKLFHPVREAEDTVNSLRQREKLNTRIVYVLVTEEPKYMYFLHLSIFSLLNFHSCRITVLTDQSTVIDEYISSHAKILRIDIPDMYDTRKKSRFLKTQVGTIIEGRFLFIDCDTLVIGSLKDVDDFDDEIACGVEYNNPYIEDQNYIVANTEAVGYIPHVNRMAYHNSGVLFSNGSEKAKAFFQQWHENWKDYCSRFNKEIDQPAMHKTNISIGNIIRKLPDKYNWMIYMNHYICRNIKIIHYWHKAEGNLVLQEIIKLIERGEALRPEYINAVVKSM